MKRMMVVPKDIIDNNGNKQWLSMQWYDVDLFQSAYDNFMLHCFPKGNSEGTLIILDTTEYITQVREVKRIVTDKVTFVSRN